MIKTICFTEAAWEDYVWWQRQDQKTLRRINQLIHNACRTPFEGLGKPEPLRESLSGFGHDASIKQTVSCMRTQTVHSMWYRAGIITDNSANASQIQELVMRLQNYS